MTDQTRAVVPAQDNTITMGQTHIDASDLVLPRVKVVQQMSAEAQGPKADRRAEAGEFFDTLRGISYGDVLRFIPIMVFKQRVMLVRDDRLAAINEQLTAAKLAPLAATAKGLVCRSFDMIQGTGSPGIACGECPLAQWRGDAPPFCSETYNVAAMTGEGDLVVLSFSKSSAKVGKRVFSMLRMTSGVPWARVYEARTRSQSNDKGTFYVPEVTVTKDVTSTELLSQAVKWSKTLGMAEVLDVTPVDEDEEVVGRPASEVDDSEDLPF